jgi:cytochrome c-type biogenesis protein CcsB
MTTFVVLLATEGSVWAGGLDFTGLREVAVQKDGRKKPLDTVALETVQKLTGKRWFTDPDTGRKMPAVEVLVSMWLEARDWSDAPVVLVSYKPLKAHLGLPADTKYFSYRQLATPALEQLLRLPAGKGRKSGLQNEADVVHQRLRILIGAVGPDALPVVPHPNDPKGAWQPVTKSAEAEELRRALGAAYARRDAAAFSEASERLATALRAMSPAVYPATRDLRREVRYNSFHPFGKALLFYMAAFVWLLATWRARRPVVYWAGIAAFVAGVVVHGYGFWLRILISGRPPITNMYESVVWVSFGAGLFALVLELIHRQRYCVVAVAPISIAMLAVADQFPAVLDPSIGPLAPVLRDNFWLTAHVPAITLGYAAFAVATGVGHVALGYYVFAPAAAETIRRLEQFIYRAMQIGVLLLAAGTILGGIWAHYAWGRFWGWDPKETWSLIALVCYLVPLHGRVAGWMSGFALSAASAVCFMAVLMAWYGVNFVLGTGLHSYGFGTGGLGFVLGFVAVELAIVAAAAWRRTAVLREA